MIGKFKGIGSKLANQAREDWRLVSGDGSSSASGRRAPSSKRGGKTLPFLRFRSAPWWPQSVPLLLFGVICTAGLLIAPLHSPKVQAVFHIAQIIAALWGAFACLVAARSVNQDGMARTPWQILCASLLCYAAGLAIHILAEWFRPRGARFPGLADIFWVLQQPLMTVALLQLSWLRLTRSGKSLDSLRVGIDTLIVVLSALILSWSLLIEQRFTDPDISALSRLLYLYYPLGDVALLFGSVLLFFAARGRLHHTRAAGLMLLGVGSFVVTTSIYLYRVLHHLSPATGFATGTSLDAGWIWGCLLIGSSALAYSVIGEREQRTEDTASIPVALEGAENFAAYIVDEEVETIDDDEEQHERRWQHFIIIWLPYVAALGVAMLLIYYEYRSGSVESVQRMLPALSLLMAIVARQMLTLWDNTKLAERLREANSTLEMINTDLEQNVKERTQHLATLHGITSTLNTSLDRRTVLRVALERTMAATGADGGGIWLRVIEEETPGASTGDEDRNYVWKVAHTHGFNNSEVLLNMLRDLAVAAADETGTNMALMPSTRLAEQSGFNLSPTNVVLVPIRWGGALLGTFGLLRREGSFNHDDRALAESVAMETGTALQNARLYQEARHRADRDSVTNLLNHRAMQERLNASLSLSRRHKVELTVVMMDLNNFKFFNDTYGHPTGDEVLRTVARHLQEVCRENDIVGRYGGDEFIVLLPDTGGDGARDFCLRVGNRLGEQHFQADSGTRIPIEMSFGWAVYPQDADSALELLTLADSNLYEYKHSGGFRKSNTEVREQSRIEIRKLKNRASGGSFGVLDALVTAIDNKDRYTRRHSEEVTHYSLLVAKELGYSEEALRAVRISGLLHDVGKIAVPDEILRHPGHLENEEWEIMKQHPVFGALIVKDLPHLDEVLDGVRHHHERWDGKGYPDALKENDIPIMGRLLAVGDCFSAMTTNRPYRKAFAPEDALREIERGAGIQFDPAIAKTFIKVMRRELSGSSHPQDAVPTISSIEMEEEISRDADSTAPAPNGNGMSDQLIYAPGT